MPVLQQLFHCLHGQVKKRDAWSNSLQSTNTRKTSQYGHPSTVTFGPMLAGQYQNNLNRRELVSVQLIKLSYIVKLSFMHVYTGEACKLKVRRKLAKLFPSPMQALPCYGLPQPGSEHAETQTDISKQTIATQTQQQQSDSTTQTNAFLTSESKAVFIRDVFSTLTSTDQIALVQQLFKMCCPTPASLPAGFIKNAISAMENLHNSGKSNVIAGIARALGKCLPVACILEH